MKAVTLGRTGLHVSPLGLGGIQFSKFSEREVAHIIHRAWDLGINFIETARGYWDSEEKIGKAIKGFRENIVLASKNGKTDASEFTQELENSLSALDTDHIELYQFHGVDREDAFEKIMDNNGAFEAAQKAQRQGKIGHIAISTHSLKISKKVVKENIFCSVQLPISFINEEISDSGILEEAVKKKIGLIAMKPFGGGRLGDARLCLGYVYSLPGVIPVVGIDDVEQVEELVRLTEEGITLTSEDLAGIERIKKSVGTHFCRACRYCEPCPVDISIYQVLYFPVYIKQFGAERALAGSHKQTEKSAQCTECGQCEERCPFHLKIIEGMKKSRELLNTIKQNET